MSQTPSILTELAQRAQHRVAVRLATTPLATLRANAEALVEPMNARGASREAFESALRRPGLRLIGEVKRASPSKGMIAPVFPYQEIAQSYERAGIDAISVLTEPTAFLGDDQYLASIAQTVQTPLLRKDFTVHEAMIYEAKLLGASAVLLIVSLLSPSVLKGLLDLAHELDLAALVETHNPDEIAVALDVGATVIGVNNRNLHTFEVNTEHAQELRALVPPEAIYVAESGIQTLEDVRAVARAGADAALIGEMLMRSEDREGLIRLIREVGQ